MFVCTGNICRSPTAEAVFRKMADAAGLAVEADSAGLADYHVGHPPDPRSREAARERGYDLSSLRARTVSLRDFTDFDLIVAMDRGHFNTLMHLAPDDASERICMMTDYASRPPKSEDVPDPYYGGAQGFEDVLDLLEDSCAGLVASLKAAVPEPR
nr:low molecular weight protein-tyrosine-phosphatase [Phaeovibrio sulfidiphilus]